MYVFFALVGEHQLEVRESLPCVKPGLFQYYGTFQTVVGHISHAIAWKDRQTRYSKKLEDFFITTRVEMLSGESC